jgi:pimeloyl-ACP methyl ester carboxylesterase
MNDQAAGVGVRLLALDRPGIGLSDNQPRRTLADWAQDVRDFANAAQLSNFPVLGWSCGAFYSLACARYLNDIISKAGTVGAIAPPDDQTIRELGMVEDKILFRCPDPMRPLLAQAIGATKLLPPHMVKQSLLDKLKSESDRAVVSGMPLDQATNLFYECIRHGGGGAVEDYRAARLPWSFTPQEIETETIMWHGTEDNLAPMSGAERLASMMPCAGRLIRIPSHGHFLLYHKAAEVLTELLAPPGK